ncbi:MAG: aminotransferase class V-fold PLP-dependent enzyme, partial [Euryarchaeota archaeon]|nr:aminotransferase class V-fold PLP-dependent enzyme [Euryarchaeota archaeon]
MSQVINDYLESQNRDSRMSRIYLDHAATSPLVDKAREEMIHVMETVHGNPSSPHLEGREASRLLSKYRNDIASWLGAQPSQVVFTSGATESNNMAIGSFAGSKLITSRAEHKAVLEPAAARGNAVLIDTDAWGSVHLESVEAHWEDEALVSLMWVNNETGAVTDVDGIAEWV